VGYMLSRIQTDSVITKAAEELRRFIEGHNLGPGDALPAETQLSGMLGISRNSVREALRVLDGLGFIEKRPGRGAVVRSRIRALAGRPPGRDAVVEGIPVAYEARRLIEERCAELAAERATEANHAELRAPLARFEEALKRLDFVAAAAAHVEFHETLVRVAGNPILASMFESVRFTIAEFTESVPEAFKDPRLPSLHRAICQAIELGDRVAAAKAVRRHFQANRPRLEVNIRTGGGRRPAASAR
jgi:GntR family transcriptional regulator, transcriptional repressor for pyruvate dehydrogenase complex